MADEPSCSAHTSKGSGAIEDIDIGDITLNIKDDEAEIARLDLQPPQQSNENEDTPTASKTENDDDERIAKIEFHCVKCDMKEMVHYYGQKPPFVCGVQFVEDTFVMRDPFQPPPPRWKAKAEYFVALGAKCVQCERTVCRDNECSFYYTRTYCLPCAQANVNRYPIEAQTRLKKQLAAI